MNWRIAIAFAAGAAALLGQTEVAPHIDFPGSTLTNANGINNAGDIVGGFNDGRTYHGFLCTACFRPK